MRWGEADEYFVKCDLVVMAGTLPRGIHSEAGCAANGSLQSFQEYTSWFSLGVSHLLCSFPCSFIIWSLLSEPLIA